jgi:cysteine desulfurase family protein (TIGR01976 family)
MGEFPISWVRDNFPALNVGDEFVFFDNGGGAQIPHAALDAVQQHLILCNVQRGGKYRQSVQVDAAIQRARESVAIFLNASSPDEVAFGMNATSFIRIVSQGIEEILGNRPEIVVTDIDHEANIATWLVLEKHGAQIRWWKVREDGSLHTDDLAPLLSSRTRLVACALASNALGSIIDVKEVCRLAHSAGAEVFVDAVHYAPHAPLDVQELDCDYLVCSGYKIFAPHMGFLWGKAASLDALPTFREDFIPDRAPLKIEVGTFVYENVAGMNAALGYLEDLGRRTSANGHQKSRRDLMLQAMNAIRSYELGLSAHILTSLQRLPGVTIYGISDPEKVSGRVPTVSFNVKDLPAPNLAQAMADRSIAVRSGNMYSPRLLKRLGVSTEDGLVRASLVHYNTADEIGRFIEVLARITGN